MAGPSMGASRFLAPFYWVNGVLLSGCAVLLHAWALRSDLAHSQFASLSEFVAIERQMGVFVAAVLVWHWLRRRSLDGFVAALIFYAKLVLGVNAAMLDWRLGAWTGLLLWAAFCVLPQPLLPMSVLYDSGEGKVALMSPTSIKQQVLAGDAKQAWLLMFYTEQHGPSIAMAPAFAAVAQEYASDKLAFGAIDACLWPSLARELRLETNTWTNQLPAVVRYVRGKEAGRVPVAVDSSYVRRNHFTAADLVKLFDLPRLSSEGAGGSSSRSPAKQR